MGPHERALSLIVEGFCVAGYAITLYVANVDLSSYAMGALVILSLLDLVNFARKKATKHIRIYVAFWSVGSLIIFIALLTYALNGNSGTFFYIATVGSFTIMLNWFILLIRKDPPKE